MGVGAGNAQVLIDGTRATVFASGEIDVATVEGLRKALAECLGAGCREVTVDMSGVTFMDSSGVAAFVLALNTLGPRGVLRIANTAPGIRRVLQISGLSHVLDEAG